MPRRSLLTPAERAGLLAFPTSDDDLIRHYTFSEPDLSVIRQRRGLLVGGGLRPPPDRSPIIARTTEV